MKTYYKIERHFVYKDHEFWIDDIYADEINGYEEPVILTKIELEDILIEYKSISEERPNEEFRIVKVTEEPINIEQLV